MTKRYLHDIFFETAGPIEPDQRKKLRQAVSVQLRSASLRAFFFDALKNAQLTLENPSIREICIRTSSDLVPKVEVWKNGSKNVLYCDIPINPLSFVDVPIDNKVLGELYISWIEHALTLLSEYSQVPTELIRKTTNEYRRKDYTYSFVSGERRIQGTKLKGRLHGKLSCEGLERYITLILGSKEIHTQKVSWNSVVPNTTFWTFSEFELHAGVLKVIDLPDLDEGRESWSVDLTSYVA